MKAKYGRRASSAADDDNESSSSVFQQTEITFKLGLRPPRDSEDFKPTVNMVASEYATRYLEQLGVKPSKTTLDMVHKSIPLTEKCIKTTLRSEGHVTDEMQITVPAVHFTAKIPQIVNPIVMLQLGMGNTEAAAAEAADAFHTANAERKISPSGRMLEPPKQDGPGSLFKKLASKYLYPLNLDVNLAKERLQAFSLKSPLSPRGTRHHHSHVERTTSMSLKAETSAMRLLGKSASCVDEVEHLGIAVMEELLQELLVTPEMLLTIIAQLEAALTDWFKAQAQETLKDRLTREEFMATIELLSSDECLKFFITVINFLHQEYIRESPSFPSHLETKVRTLHSYNSASMRRGGRASSMSTASAAQPLLTKNQALQKYDLGYNVYVKDRMEAAERKRLDEKRQGGVQTATSEYYSQGGLSRRSSVASRSAGVSRASSMHFAAGIYDDDGNTQHPSPDPNRAGPSRGVSFAAHNHHHHFERHSRASNHTDGEESPRASHGGAPPHPHSPGAHSPGAHSPGPGKGGPHNHNKGSMPRRSAIKFADTQHHHHSSGSIHSKHPVSPQAGGGGLSAEPSSPTHPDPLHPSRVGPHSFSLHSPKGGSEREGPPSPSAAAHSFGAPSMRRTLKHLSSMTSAAEARESLNIMGDLGSGDIQALQQARLFCLQKEFATLYQHQRSSRAGMFFVMPVFMLALRLLVSMLFSSLFSAWAKTQEGVDSMEAMDKALQFMFDPHGYLQRNLSLIQSTPSAVSVLAKYPHRSHEAQRTHFHDTSPMVAAALANPISADTRRLLAKSGRKKVPASGRLALPTSVPAGAPRVALTEAQQDALFREAHAMVVVEKHRRPDLSQVGEPAEFTKRDAWIPKADS